MWESLQMLESRTFLLLEINKFEERNLKAICYFIISLSSALWIQFRYYLYSNEGTARLLVQWNNNLAMRLCASFGVEPEEFVTELIKSMCTLRRKH